MPTSKDNKPDHKYRWLTDRWYLLVFLAAELIGLLFVKLLFYMLGMR